MALRGTLTHWKTRTLADDLGISPAHALGLLEALWHTTAEDAPAGNIGRLPNRAIAMQMHTDFDPDRLIAAMIKSGHLDEHPAHRLIVHDWDKHADHNTKRKVERRGEKMCSSTGETSPTPRQSGGSDASSHIMTSHDQPLVNDKSIPEPEPEPVPEPVPEPEKDSSRGKREKRKPDPRHTQFQKATKDYWESKNRGIEMPWDGSEGKALSLLLKANPNLGLEKFTLLLCNRYRSDLNHSARPCKWLHRATDFAGGPLNEFGNPKVAVGNKRAPRAEDFSTKKYAEDAGLAPGCNVGVF